MGVAPQRRERPAPKEITVDVADLSHDGRGVARGADGKVLFVAGALPGERVRARLTRRPKHADDAETIAVEAPSPDRTAPGCRHFGVCGGCSLQHLAPPAQALFKQKQLLDALERIGHVRSDAVAAPLMGPPWGYRRRARLSVRHVAKKGGVLVGFRERESPYVAQLETCEVLDPRVGHKLAALAECVGRLNAATLVPQIEIAATDDAVGLVFRVMQPPSEADCAILQEFGEREGFQIYLQTGGLDSIRPLAPPAAPLTFSPAGGLRLEFEPADFIQVNDAVNRQMVAQALAWLAARPGDAVLELFCGLGNFSLPLAQAGARVTAVEGDRSLVERARRNAQRNGLEVRFEKADLFVPDAQWPWLRERYAAVLLDPPRAGAREVLPHVVAGRPERIVYVSCHPATLARDAGELVQRHGYRLSRAGVLDMFPHTNHVESMALFERET